MRGSLTQTRSSRKAALSNGLPLSGPLHVSVPLAPLVHLAMQTEAGGGAGGAAGFVAAAGGGACGVAGLVAAAGGEAGGGASCGSSLPQPVRASATTSEDRKRRVVMGPG